MNNSIVIKNKIEVTALIKVSSFKQEIRKTNPHKHNNYIEIIYFSQANGIHGIDNTLFPITPATVFLIHQEQVHYWDITSKPKGFVLILKKEFIQNSLDYQLKELLSQLSEFSCLNLNNTKSVDTIFNLLLKEKNLMAIEGLLKALLVNIIIESTPKPILSNKSDTLNLFQDLLKQADKLHNNVSYYAQKLKTSPQNLNAICRKTLKQSASEIIAKHIIDEAKRQLLYSQNRISEIAYYLNFNDSSYFIKYFKRFTGLTPKEFRKK
ncbi:helix-turn-helix domain-containing protein [Myroides marinus]|uniref:helix-turn-helix domain-containing protein n=1 Tax=Myroides marinus TaxID=703342 RepID=UPI002574904A|nr:helix-turn-helix transcriptional regulator [Myroides marinus]MDM1391639.1 helix-turn-helix domain-containing protein [Myroides marinus]